MMFAERHHGARLRPFGAFGMLRHETHLAADFQFVEGIAGNAVAVEVDLLAARGRDKAAIAVGRRGAVRSTRTSKKLPCWCRRCAHSTTTRHDVIRSKN